MVPSFWTTFKYLSCHMKLTMGDVPESYVMTTCPKCKETFQFCREHLEDGKSVFCPICRSVVYRFILYVPTPASKRALTGEVSIGTRSWNPFKPKVKTPDSKGVFEETQSSEVRTTKPEGVVGDEAEKKREALRELVKSVVGDR